jgi:hypothetical protein
MELIPRSYIRNVYMIRQSKKINLPEHIVDYILEFYDSRYQDKNINRIWYYLGRETCNIDRLSYVISVFLRQQFLKTKTKGFWLDDIFDDLKAHLHHIIMVKDPYKNHKFTPEDFFGSASENDLAEYLGGSADYELVKGPGYAFVHESKSPFWFYSAIDKSETFYHNATFYGYSMSNLLEHLTSKQDVKKVISKENKDVIIYFINRVLDYTDYFIYLKITGSLPLHVWDKKLYKKIDKCLNKLNKKCYKILDFVNSNCSK